MNHSLYSLYEPNQRKLLKKIVETPKGVQKKIINNFFQNWNSLHARLNSHYQAWSYKKKKHKKIKAYTKSV